MTEVIYLAPLCQEHERMWCEHDAPVDCECVDGPHPWIKYVAAMRQPTQSDIFDACDVQKHTLIIDQDYASHTVKVKSLNDVQSAQSNALREAVIEKCAKALEADAKKCDCFALEERECGCGAWCEWKSITSARAVEIVRALLEKK